jgi:hypothetical protein
MSSSETVEIGEEFLQHMRCLLAAHYIDGDVPSPVVVAVESALKSVNQWFPDPQYAYHPDEGYL